MRSKRQVRRDSTLQVVLLLGGAAGTANTWLGESAIYAVIGVALFYFAALCRVEAMAADRDCLQIRDLPCRGACRRTP